MKTYKKTATVKAKLFEKGDEDGMLPPESYTNLDAIEDGRYGIKPPLNHPYVKTLENQFLRGEFGKHYLCIGKAGERWLVGKEIFEATYEVVFEETKTDKP